MRVFRSAVLSCVVLPASIVAAQSGPAPPLSLSQAVNEAIERNPELLALRAQAGVHRTGPEQQRSLPPPMLEAQAWQWPVNTLNPARTDMFMFMLTQDLPGRGKRATRAALAEKDVGLAENAVVARTREIVAQVKVAYADVYVARKADEIDRSAADLLRDLADVAQAKYETGRISQQDVLKPIVELSHLHEELIKITQQGSAARARLNALMHRRPDGPIGELAEAKEMDLTASSRELQDLAVQQHPELRAARLRVDRAGAALAVTRLERKPDFSIQGGYMLLPRDTDAWTGRIGITWPGAPWAKKGIAARVAQDTASVAASMADEAVVENAVRLAVEDAYVRAKSAQQRAALLRTTILPQSQQTLDISRIAYQANKVEFLAMLDNQRMLLDARLSYYRALAEQDQALADLERAIGGDLTTAIVKLTSVGEVK